MFEEILSNLTIKKVYSATSVFTNTNAKNKRIYRERWAIIIKFEGETVYHTNGKTYVSNINNMVILPKGCSYEWLCTKAGRYAVVEFDSDSSCNEIIYFPNINGERILPYFNKLEYIRTIKKPMYEMESIKESYSIILKLIYSKQRKYVSPKKSQKLVPAMEYIAKNYNREIKNEDLAHLTGLSTVYFRKLFTEVYGISPISYIHELRIKKAKEMLKSDYGTITDIALSLGYLNIYDFSRDFKKRTGISPSKYM